MSIKRESIMRHLAYYSSGSNSDVTFAELVLIQYCLNNTLVLWFFYTSFLLSNFQVWIPGSSRQSLSAGWEETRIHSIRLPRHRRPHRIEDRDVQGNPTRSGAPRLRTCSLGSRHRQSVCQESEDRIQILTNFDGLDSKELGKLDLEMLQFERIPRHFCSRQTYDLMVDSFQLTKWCPRWKGLSCPWSVSNPEWGSSSPGLNSNCSPISTVRLYFNHTIVRIEASLIRNGYENSNRELFMIGIGE